MCRLQGLTKFIKEHAVKEFELPKKQAEEDAEEAAADAAQEQEVRLRALGNPSV